MKELGLLFNSKRTFLGLGLLGGLIYSSYNISENSASFKKISAIDSGIQTCYTRVNQTYTAKLLDDSASQYLTQNFQALTEECFAESMVSLDENFKNQLTSANKKLSNLASNVHWFHEDLISPNSKNALSNNESKDIGVRFEKIENTKDEILEELEAQKTKLSTSLGSFKNIFYVSAALLTVVLMFEYLAGTRKKLSNNAREIEAEKEMRDQGGVNSVKLGEIIRLALEQNNLYNCAKLFNNYYVHATFEKSIRTKNKSTIENLVTPETKIFNDSVTESFNKKTLETTQENIDKIWNDDTIGFVADSNNENTINLSLDTFTGKVVDALSDKFFSNSIAVDVKIDDKICVKGDAEVLEQVLYHSINFAANSTLNSAQKLVKVSALKLGDIIALEISASGIGLDLSLANELNLTSHSNLDLQIVETLISEIDGKMQLDNKISQSGEVVGPRIKLILKGAPTPISSKLVDLKKGSKKEILSQINSASLIAES